MELGISTYTYGWAFRTGGCGTEQALQETDLIGLAGELQVSLIQVGDNLPLHTFSAERLMAFKHVLRKKNVRIEIGARGLSSTHLRQYIGICGELGAGILRFVTDDEGYRPSVMEIIQIIRNHLSLLQEHKIVLAIENHDRLKTKELAEIVGTVDSPNAGICLDTVNSLGAGEGMEEVIEILGPYTVNLHIKDFGIRRLEHKQGFIIDGRIAGEGMLDIPWLFRSIRSFHRCRTCILEQWVPPENDEMGTIAKERQWAQKSIAYIKSKLL